jgi:nitrogen fixation protein FixH
MTDKRVQDGSARRNWHFPAIVIGLLLFSVGWQAYLVLSSQSDGGAQVESNYYTRAAAWDEQQDQEAVSRALGWTLDLRATLNGGVEMTVTDSRGAPVQGLSGAVALHRPSVANQIGEAPLVPVGPGKYTAAVPLRKAGLWDFTVRAARSSDAPQYQHTVRLDVGG